MDYHKILIKTSENKLAAIGVAIGVSFWFVESAIHAYIFYFDSFINEILSPNPHEVWMRSLVVFVFVLFGFYCQFLVNKRKWAEQKVRESEVQLRTILDTVQTGIILIDPDSNAIVDANTVAIAMIGDRKEDIIGGIYHKYMAMQEQVESKTGDQPYASDNVNGVLITANGKDIPILKTATRILLSGRTYLLESFLDISSLKKAEQERERLIGQLQDALATVKTLSGLLPICASCKKIKDERGHWEQIESYIRDHSVAEFTHCYCPECAKKFLKEFRDKGGMC
ncbi:MAG: PAS domain S-box protein [Pseudomonadota bacterium]